MGVFSTVEVGSMSIGGSIDTSLIERGFRRIGQGFDKVKSSAKSFGSDMVRIGQSVGGLVKGLGVLGGVGLGAIVGLAKNAPAVAPAMAKIGVEFQRLTRILGEQLQPYFNKFSETFTKFVSFVGAHPDITKVFAVGAAGLTGIAAFTKLIGMLTGGAVAASILTALGYAAVIGGIAYAGAKGAEHVAGKTREFLTTEAESIPGTLQSLASVDKSAGEIAAEGFQPTPGGMIGEYTGPSRKNMLLRWWDAMWS